MTLVGNVAIKPPPLSLLHGVGEFTAITSPKVRQIEPGGVPHPRPGIPSGARGIQGSAAA